MATKTTLDDPSSVALATQTNHNVQELNTASAIARVQAETQAAIVVAQRMRRSEAQARQELLSAIKASPRLAEKSTYHYPRGKKQDPVTGEWSENIISGPSVYLARESARVWGNVAYGTEIVRDDEGERQIRSFAWDMQSNVRIYAEASFKKLVQRVQWVNKNGKREKETINIVPDERDLRELTNRYASIGERNCILKVIPSHLTEEAQEVASTVTKKDAADNPGPARDRLVDAFDTLGISAALLEEYLGHPMQAVTPDEIVKLRGVFQSIRDGNATWEDYRNPTPLPSVQEVPELPALKELAAKLKWNDARLSNEIGRHKQDIPKLIAAMTEQVAQMNVSPQPGTAAQKTNRQPQQRSLVDAKDF